MQTAKCYKGKCKISMQNLKTCTICTDYKTAFRRKKERNDKDITGKYLWRMKQFYETYNALDEKLSPLVRQISWSNNLAIMSRCKTIEERHKSLLQKKLHDIYEQDALKEE